ncbi:MAG: AsmA family protein [Gammaproteobacteria bacterium]|nr:AsmA family protein [Gammaproteobacteria bacterium]
MKGSSIVRWGLKYLAMTLATLLVAVALLVTTVTLMDANRFRGPLGRFVAARTGREIRIDGALQAHLFSLHPRLTSERVVIGNPPWTPPGRTAEIGRLSLVFELPLFGHSFAIQRLELEGAMLHLVRDSIGRANWQWADPTRTVGKGPPLIRSLSMPSAHVDLDDARRHLQFAGTVSAQDASGAQGIVLLRIEGSGHLNGRANTFAINGDPLATVTRARPYRFTFAERSSGSHLAGRGFLSQPFDFRALDTTFEATGEDLKDLYFLTGLTLPNTGTYRLSGRLTRQGTSFKFSDLLATSGHSDVHGTLSVETSSGRSQIDAELHSQLLRLSDLGARAAGRVSEPRTAKRLLLPDSTLPLVGLRRSDAVVNFHAHGVDVGRVSLHAVAAKVTIDHGVLSVTPLSADFFEGKITGGIRFDATKEVPTTDLDLRIAGLQLSQFARKDQGRPPFEGALRVRLGLTGHGRSIHELAASANGTATAVLPHGAIRASLAELTGIDLRGLGLLLTKNKEETGIRCGVASFQAHEGTLTAQTLVVDTDPVLITGQGTIHLDSEALDLAFHGKPKHLRLLRLRAPVSVRGTLAHPSIGIEARRSVAQAGAAVALGIVLTPLAAVLAFVDPGLAKDADCAALLAEPKNDTTSARAGAPTP